DAETLPLSWSEKKNVKWKTKIHDRGWSSPVIYGDQIWMTTATKDGKKMWAVCVDRRSGKILKNILLLENKKVEPLGNRLNGYASPSPVIEAGKVFVHFGSYGTFAIDTNTFKVLWKRTDLKCQHFRGPGSSPVLYKNLLILTFDGIDRQYLVALDTETGKNVWLTKRSTNFRDLDKNKKPRGNGDFRKAYCTPIIVPHGGVDQLISPGAKAVIAYEAATGKEIWHVEHDGFSAASRPITYKDMVLVNTGYGRAQLLAVKLGGRGKLGGKHIRWRQTKSMPRRASPIEVDGLIYAVDDAGVFSCLDANTGSAVWRVRLKGQSFSASPVYAAGRIFLFSQEGITTIVTPGRDAPNPGKLPTCRLGTGFMASPAIAEGAFYLRSKTHLYCIAK
ncbi:MAG: PQQ-binding-like beta-propeller repeat protein, partial [Phycisphaeraceae bacterium]|nr:PQQ-binding-like beta-propeller repeat protein [Phycisphaeraceae bacterium]